MRPKIIGLDVDAMEWSPLGPPGLYSKPLSRDPETGARTALQRMNPADGYSAPSVAHYHPTYEEILGISGYFSFDQRTWVQRNAYVFHPPRTVHGFNSLVPEDSLFLSRVGQDLQFSFVEEPAHDDLYVIEGPTPPRVPAAYGNAPEALGWTPATFLGQPVEACLLSRCPETGEGSALIKLSTGWTAPAQTRDDYLEIFALDGGFQHDDAPVIEGRAYFFIPPNEDIPAFTATRDIEIYVNFGSHWE
jgi:hypothetical protein